MSERRGIDGDTLVKVYIKNDIGTFVRGRLRHPYSGTGSIELTTAGQRQTVIIPEENVSHVVTTNNEYID